MNELNYIEGCKYYVKGDQSFLTFIHGYPIETKFYKLGGMGKLTLRDGFCFDGASGPAFDTRTIMTASAIHDCGYMMIQAGLMPASMRKAWDKELLRWCKLGGMSWLRRKYVYRAVRIFGGSHTSK